MNDAASNTLSLDQIRNVIGFPSLEDLSSSPSDIDNDIQILLDWISPIIPEKSLELCFQSGSMPQSVSTATNLLSPVGQMLKKEEAIDPKFLLPKYADPSYRVKLAIKSCFKNESDQSKFIDLYVNSVNTKLKALPQSVVANCSFMEYINMIKLMKHHYETHIDHFNLSSRINMAFATKYNSILTSFLFDNTNFRNELHNFFEKSLFNNDAFSAPLSSSITLNVIDIISTLVSVNLSECLNEILVVLSIEKIKAYTNQLCKGVWDKPLLDSIESFIQNEIYPNFSIIVSYTTSSNLTDTMNNVYLYELMKIAHMELTTLRVDEIYSLVLGYPSSEIALKELYTCLSRNRVERQDVTMNSTGIFSYMGDISTHAQAEKRSKLVDHFILSCHENLLHAGANTIDVITSYTKTIKSFLLIDPRGVLLDKVVRPIRRYLKTRDDVIVKLVHGMLDVSESNKLRDLALELNSTEKYNAATQIKDGVEDSLDLNWVPDPIDALPDFKRERISDTIESLLSIFESKEIFIEEFTKLFGHQLIASKNFNVSSIESKLNLLKSRFGKDNFTTLDIMLRDFHTSKHLNTKASRDVAILSHLYWESILDQIDEERKSFKLPEPIESEFAEFQKYYSNHKQGRKLKLVPSLGMVKLRLDVGEQVRVFEVSTDKAAIISMFSGIDHDLHIEDISKSLKMPLSMVRDGVSFWVEKEVICELSKKRYIAIDAMESSRGRYSKSQFSDIEVIEPYVMRMLSNITALNYDRVKSLLKMMVPKDEIDVTTVEDALLQSYLDHLVSSGRINFTEGNYSLLKGG
ncbi:Cullin family protein [Candida parapsilosis]|uniref:Anaphase-promoting complex subunit 2 n=2 Tax=Candida parapsilosis TaxID=5480 RepID=G8BB86_CANPC|nr:uncharacterized protein CPAR2_808590 [Candida parapsilosis]KAF6052204.1 Cullin family protein [Candida parapsilosis]KAF6052299.1 Cullin family protein [Candida parapsilosis]KAF6054006.1 Cullin family protein [Candida parapsilosis]KAF6064075.1 Cullin family protein [Candida parapsilosis]KAI5902667.1 Anaphase-promoting complex subunit 2 [Candida parapsilosis]